MSNDHAPTNALRQEVAQEVALFQQASAVVDEAAAAVFGLNQTDLRCLGRLMLGSMTAGELAAATGVSRGAMTTALDRLEAAGYVQRKPGKTDRRQVRIKMTGRATKLAEKIWGPIGAAGMIQLAGLSDEQLLFLRDFLRAGRAMQEREAVRIRALKGGA